MIGDLVNKIILLYLALTIAECHHNYVAKYRNIVFIVSPITCSLPFDPTISLKSYIPLAL